MSRVNNYLIQAQQAKERFLTYDQDALIAKLRIPFDEDYLYVSMLGQRYRLDRRTGDLERLVGADWVDANTFGEVMTLLDLVCDSREDRYLACQWESMATFGLKFHQNLIEDRLDPFAEAIQANIPAFTQVCRSLGGKPISGGDLAFSVDFFDGMDIGIQFWEGDDEFSPRVRFLWDRNALMYLKYETMHFAIGLLRKRIMEEMKNLAA